MLTLASKINIPDYIHVTTVDKDTVLLNTRTNKYFALKDVGARIWSLLKEYKHLTEIHAVLLREYDVEEKQMEIDLLELIEQFWKGGLVEVIHE